MKIEFSSIRPWLRLVRLPNLFTVPGDPLAGLFLASALTYQRPHFLQLLLTPLAALAFYMFGMILNDVLDVDEDTATRPSRPLPRRQIPLAAAQTAAVLLALAGLMLCLVLGRGTFITALVLVGLIVSYNAFLKHDAAHGPATMGMCRGVSLLLGAAQFGWPVTTILIAIMLAGFVASITYIADFENRLHHYGATALLPTAFMLGAWVIASARLLVQASIWGILAGTLVFAAGVIISVGTARELTITAALPSTSRAAVGALIRSLLIIQAGLLLICPGAGSGAAGLTLLIVGWPANVILQRRFYSS